MNKTVLVVIGALVVLAGGYLLMSGGDDKAALEQQAMEEKAMMEQKAMEERAMLEGEAMMEAEGVMVEGEAMMEKKDDAAMEKVGTYTTYSPEMLAKANEGDVVLFFKASWCPSCRALDADIKSRLSSIPAGVTILEVDYDSSTELKKKYGVTQQHTLVQVDANGEQIAKWGASRTLADVITKIK